MIGLSAACLVFSLLALSCEKDDSDPDEGDRAHKLALALADTFMQTKAPELNSWSWGDGVLMFGLTRLNETSGDQRLADYVQAYIDHHLANGYFFANNDSCIPAKSALWLAEKTGDDRYLEPLNRFEHYLYEFVPRLSDGGINHMGWKTGKAIWMDSLFMVGPLLLDLYVHSGDERHLFEIRNQILTFAAHLRDPELSLWYHRWDETKQERTPQEPIFWARGNGWVLVTMAMFLKTAPPETEGYDEIKELFISQAKAIASWQQKNGLWTTVLNHPDESYVETSSGALFAYGFSVGQRLGFLDDSYRERARNALKELADRIYVDDRKRTRLPQTSLGTSPGDLAYYNEIITAENINYGVGAYLLAVTEVYR